MSIYSNLFRYRPRPERRPKEDFLTAALQDLLTRLPPAKAIEFVGDVLLMAGRQQSTWREFTSGREPRLTWVTQVGVRHESAGIIDLLLRVDGQDAIVIESKINAPVRRHTSQIGDDGEPGAEHIDEVPTAEANQLRTYGGWLAERCSGSDWPGALILLTHHTLAPSDFVPGRPGYGVEMLNIANWSRVWRWTALQAAKHHQGPEQRPQWAELCQEFSSFLKEESMTSDYMSFHDAAAFEMFVNSSDRIESTMNLVSKTAIPPSAGLVFGSLSDVNYSAEGGLVWSWAYLIEQNIRRLKWYIGWGIRFPAVSSWWLDAMPSLPAIPHAFVAFGSDGAKMPFPIGQSAEASNLPPNWSSIPSEGGSVIGKPLHEFNPDPELLAKDFAQWVTGAVTSGAPMVKKAATSAGD